MLYPDLKEVPRRGGWLAPAIGKAVLRLAGWRVTGQLPNIRKVMAAVAPHTSNWDFIVGVAVMWALDLRLSFFGKHTLFTGPFGVWMRWIGGIPVDRSASQGLVGAAVQAYSDHDAIWFAIAPEEQRISANVAPNTSAASSAAITSISSIASSPISYLSPG